ncbi:MAG: PBP1A family penicillin-binding protein [Desulfobacterales bacterium]|nr:PBP1A family penicillin-binding protein [Desulfobacterales bacterium]
MGKETPIRNKSTKIPVDKRKSPAVRKKTTTQAKRRKPWSHVECTLFLLGISLLLTIFIGLTLYLFILLDIPNLKSVKDYQPKMTSLVLDRDHRVIKRIYEENRRVVSLDMMPELLPKAFVAAEDSRFYQHPGVDVWSIFRALFHNIRAGAKSHGGSTITQQVTRSLLLSRKKVYSRKVKEAILAYRIDTVMSKDDILYIYLNQIYLGERAFGVEAAARTYFDRKVRNLTLGQMALLAGLPQAPSRYTPFKNMELARNRQAYVLNRMAEEGYITVDEARKAYKEPVSLNRKYDDAPGGEYYVQYVTNYVNGKYGQELLTVGGLTIYASMDQTLQQKAEASIQRGLAAFSGKNEKGGNPQAAMLVMESGSGKVRALVGGADFAASQFDRAIQARRQPGSAFKPVVYAAALEKGFTPESILVDEPLNLAGTGRGKTWQPRNFENIYYGPTSLSTGLIHSRNIVAIKLLQKVGIDRVVKMARNLGIRSKIEPDLTLALGSSEVSLLEMTGAYTPFANNGSYTPPILIERIIDRHGNVLEENLSQKVRVMSERTAKQMDQMLQGVINKGTGKEAQGLKVAAGGKTGTTDSYMDAWFIGYTKDFVTGVWVGHDKKTSLGKGASGGKVAAPIWLDFMKQVESGGASN